MAHERTQKKFFSFSLRDLHKRAEPRITMHLPLNKRRTDQNYIIRCGVIAMKLDQTLSGFHCITSQKNVFSMNHVTGGPQPDQRRTRNRYTK